MLPVGSLVVAAFMLCVTAIVVSFALRWQALIRKNMRIPAVAHVETRMDGSALFEAAVAAAEAHRRARLARQERIRRILTPIAFGLSGSPVILALVALYLAADREAAIVCIMIATVGLGSTSMAYLSARHARPKATP